MDKPFLDLATLNAVHDVLHFDAKNQLEFDMYLHEQILRARHGRDLTTEEREIFLKGHFGLTEMPAFLQEPAPARG
jgi:hypothetical protein